ncbi:hypothetical protein ACFLZI_03675 [Nitrospirota bacterium]
MSNCSHLTDCPFHSTKVESLPKISRMLHEMYCFNDFKQCCVYIEFEKVVPH